MKNEIYSVSRRVENRDLHLNKLIFFFELQIPTLEKWESLLNFYPESIRSTV